MRVPLLNFEGGPEVLLLNFSGVPVPLLNFDGGPGSRGPGSRGPGPTFTPCHFNRYSNYDKVLRINAWIRCFICNLRRVKTQKTINQSVLKPKE